jgi:hypothetical protein
MLIVCEHYNGEMSQEQNACNSLLSTCIKSYYVCKIVRYLYVTLCGACTEATGYTYCWTQRS